MNGQFLVLSFFVSFVFLTELSAKHRLAGSLVLTWPDLTWLGITWLDLTRLDLAWPRLGSTWLDTTWLDSTWPDLDPWHRPDRAHVWGLGLRREVVYATKSYLWRGEVTQRTPPRHLGGRNHGRSYFELLLLVVLLLALVYIIIISIIIIIIIVMVMVIVSISTSSC